MNIKEQIALAQTNKYVNWFGNLLSGIIIFFLTKWIVLYFQYTRDTALIVGSIAVYSFSIGLKKKNKEREEVCVKDSKTYIG